MRASSSAGSPSMDSLPPIGLRVMIGVTGAWGTVQFAGPTKFSEGNWIGVEMDDCVGRNDGSVKGIRYFTCNEKRGIFVRPSALRTAADGEVDPARGRQCPGELPSWRAPPSSLSPPPMRLFKETSPEGSTQPSPGPLGGATPEERSLQRALRKATEERDVEGILALLPKALPMKHCTVEIAAAQAVLTYELHCSFSKEVEKMRTTLTTAIDSLRLAGESVKAPPPVTMADLDVHLEKAVRRAVDAATAAVTVQVSDMIRSSSSSAPANGRQADGQREPKAQGSAYRGSTTEVVVPPRWSTASETAMLDAPTLMRLPKEDSREAKDTAGPEVRSRQSELEHKELLATTITQGSRRSSSSTKKEEASVESRAVNTMTTGKEACEVKDAAVSPSQPSELEDKELIAAATKIQAIRRGQLSRKPKDIAEGSSTAVSDPLVSRIASLRGSRRLSQERKEAEQKGEPSATSYVTSLCGRVLLRQEASAAARAADTRQVEARAATATAARRSVDVRESSGLAAATGSNPSELEDAELTAAATRIQAIRRGQLARKQKDDEVSASSPAPRSNEAVEARSTTSSRKSKATEDASESIAFNGGSSSITRRSTNAIVSEDAENSNAAASGASQPSELEDAELRAAATRIQAIRRGQLARKQKDTVATVEASIVEMPKLADPEPLAATVASIRGSRRLSQRLQEAPQGTELALPSDHASSYVNSLCGRVLQRQEASAVARAADARQVEARAATATAARRSVDVRESSGLAAAAGSNPGEAEDAELTAAATRIQAIRRGQLARKQKDGEVTEVSASSPAPKSNEAVEAQVPAQPNEHTDDASAYISSLLGRALLRKEADMPLRNRQVQ